MAYNNTNTNMTTTEGLSPAMVTYYNRALLKTFEPELVHLQFGEEYMMPMNNGLVMNMRKVLPIEGSTNPLSEGDPGEGVLMSEVELTVQLEQYGQYGRFTDKFDFANFDINLARKVETFARAGARSIDALVREELATCPNVIYANGKTGRSALTAADKCTTVELRKAVKFLKENLAQRFDGNYVAIVSPSIIFDLQDDETFISVAKYQDKEKVYNGEVGRLFGVRLVESTEAKVFEGAGSGGADVASIIVLGQNAYGYTSWKGANPRTIIKPVGSAGTADPLDQINTVGWKMDGFGVKLLQPEFAVRIECGFTA